MDALCLDVMNSDWHDWRGRGKHEDHLLRPGWLEQLATRWNLPVNAPPDANTIADLQSLRALMLRMAQAFMQQHIPTQEDIAVLNTYLGAAPARLHLARMDERYELRQTPLHNDWRWALREVAASFATLLVEHEPSHLKQCNNPDCRWVYYDESWNQSRRWCEDSCANLMRVRRFRARRRESSQQK